MNLGVCYWKLSASANGEVERTVERLFRIVQQTIDRPALAVLKIIVMVCVQFGHTVLQSDYMCRLPKGSTAGRYPSNGAIQSGYVSILRLPWWISITRLATMLGPVLRLMELDGLEAHFSLTVDDEFAAMEEFAGPGDLPKAIWEPCRLRFYPVAPGGQTNE